MKYFILLIVSLVMVAPAVAQEDFDLIEKRKLQRAVGFTPHDLDFNGELDSLEIHKLIISDFQQMDVNGDHKVDATEQKTAIDRFGQTYEYVYYPRIEKMQRDIEARFKTVDRNADGMLSYPEYFQYFSDRYNRMDLDKNGTVSLMEFRPIPEKVSPTL